MPIVKNAKNRVEGRERRDVVFHSSASPPPFPIMLNYHMQK
jgi:hypothetical protein